MSVSQSYYVPESSKWPIIASIGLVSLLTGLGALFVYANTMSLIILLFGVTIVLFTLFGWFSDVIKESISGLYSNQMDKSFRWGMFWFIFSEVLFFAAFFGALFYVRTLALPWLNGEGHAASTTLIWQEFVYYWPLMNNPDPSIVGPASTISPLGLPLVNTALLITSSFTVTFAHHALKEDKRLATIAWMWVSVILGSIFLYVQGYEYILAYTEYGLTLDSGIYGSTFFMLTGFHGLHVTMGTIMLLVITFRLMKGHFSKKNHFGFEAVAWYWHFVDVVWIGLFLFVYIL